MKNVQMLLILRKFKEDRRTSREEYPQKTNPHEIYRKAEKMQGGISTENHPPSSASL